MEVKAEHGWDFFLKADPSSDSCDFIAAFVLCCRERKKKKRKGIHIRWQDWEAEEEGGVFNISDSLLLNVVPEPSLHWVAEWGGCFKLTCGNKSESHCFFVFFGWILCCVRDVISMWVCTDCINNWFTWLLIAHLLEKKTKTLLLQTRLPCIAFCLLAVFSLIHCNAVLYT